LPLFHLIADEQLAQHLEDILEDPSKIKLQVPKDDVASCYYPSIHSGGDYDVRVSAGSDDKQLSHDVITVSLGARYKNVSIGDEAWKYR
jgi:nucleosome binding factor SPN SPT16 subunit